MTTQTLVRSGPPLPQARVVPGPGPITPTPRTRATIAALLGLALVLGAFSVRCFRVIRADSITADESTYLEHALHDRITGDDLDMWGLGSPRLPHLLGAQLAYWALRDAGLVPTSTGDELVNDVRRLVLSGSDRVLVAARVVGLLWGLGLLIVVFLAVRRHYGAGLGLVAAAVLSLVPEVLAHSSIAGSDMPFTTAAVLALVALGHYAERPSLKRWVVLALAIGLAWAMRHTALVLLPLAGLVHLVLAVRARPPIDASEWVERAVRSVWAGAGLSLIAFLVLWAGDGLGTVTVREVSERVTMLPVPRALGPLDLSDVPVPTSFLSILKQVRHQNQGHEAYFLGEFGTTGWPRYFPVAFLLKTPIGFLGLMVLAAARLRPRYALEIVALAFLAILWTMLIRNKVTIGVRYALPTYPLAVLFLARLFHPQMLRDRLWGPITIGLTAWLIWASIGSEGRFLSYFNEIGGGPRHGWVYLADSNIDWGQDLNALAETVTELGITEITTDIHTERRLELRGVYAIANPSKLLQVQTITEPNRRLYNADGDYIPVFTRYVAVSITRLLGLYSNNDMSWLLTRKLVRRVGDSILLFDMDLPAERALCP